ncbi:MAG: helix-turn-helix transcriptional regulator [Christensenellales bacterium]|jgi:predicted DNA-binding transcriptional regulator YafY
MRTERLLKTLYLLLEKGRMTAADLALMHEVSVRTVYRDLEALAVAGFPVCAIRGRGGGVGIMEGFTLDRVIINQAEKDLMLQALSGFRQADPKVAQGLLQKMRALFERPAEEWIEIDLSRWWEPVPDASVFDMVKEAIFARRQLQIAYCSSTSGTTQRRVCPVKISYKHSAWYLQAYCLTALGFRQFKLSRILSLEKTDLPFPEGVGPAPALQAGTAGKSIRLMFRVPERLAFRVYDEFGASQVSREADGSLLVSAPVTEGDWLISYFLSFAGEAEVVEPPELKSALVQAARKILKGLEIS